MSSIYEEIIKRLDTLATDIAALTINEGAGAAGGSLSGSGTTNRIAQWTGSASLGDSTLIKTGAGVLTLSAAADYTLTVPATGTGAMGAGAVTVTSTNNATIADHTHAATSSSNPGAAARLLASDANGYLRLTRIGLNKTPTSALDVVGQSVLNYSATSAAANAIGTTALLTKTADADDARTNATLTATTSLAGTFAYSGPNCAITASLYHDGSGLVGDAIGLYFIGGVRSTGNITNLDIFRARPSGAGSGTIGSLSCFRAFDMGVSGTPTTMYGVRIDTSTGAVGTSKYGLYVFNISGAATNNYALFTNAGLVQFGDQLKIDGSADRIQEIVQAHSTQTTNLTEWQSSAAGVLGFISGTGTAKFSGYKAAVTTKTANYTATVNDQVIVANKATAITITLPAATGTGQHYHISSIGAGACTIQCNAAETIWGSNTQTLYQYESLDLWDYAAGVWTA